MLLIKYQQLALNVTNFVVVVVVRSFFLSSTVLWAVGTHIQRCRVAPAPPAVAAAATTATA